MFVLKSMSFNWEMGIKELFNFSLSYVYKINTEE